MVTRSPVCAGAFDRVVMHALLAHDLQRPVDLCVSDLQLRALDGPAGDVSKLNFRIDLERGAVFESLASSDKRLRFEARIPGDAEILLADGFAETPLQRVSEHFLPHLRAVLLRTTLSGTLPGRKPCILTVRVSRFRRLSIS